MAKINLGALAQDVRGSLAGTTFSKGRGGSIVRQKVSPVQPRTARQLAQRAIFSAASQAWRALTEEQRADWQNYATSHKVVDVFGMARTLSGIAAFTMVNGTRMTAGLALTQDPPADVTPGPNANSATADGATGEVEVVFTEQPGVSAKFLVYTTAGQSPGVNFVNAAFRLAGIVTGVDATLAYTVTPTDLNPRLPFGTGNKVGVRVVAIGTNGVVQSSTLFLPIAD
jgi:hypothetical protein